MSRLGDTSDRMNIKAGISLLLLMSILPNGIWNIGASHVDVVWADMPYLRFYTH